MLDVFAKYSGYTLPPARAYYTAAAATARFSVASHVRENLEGRHWRGDWRHCAGARLQYIVESFLSIHVAYVILILNLRIIRAQPFLPHLFLV